MKYIMLAWNGREGKGSYAESDIYAEALDVSSALALEYENCAVYQLNDDGTFVGVERWKNGIDKNGNTAMPYDGTAVLRLIEYE